MTCKIKLVATTYINTYRIFKNYLSCFKQINEVRLGIEIQTLIAKD